MKVTVLTVLGTVSRLFSGGLWLLTYCILKVETLLFFMFLATLMIPDQVTLVPRFIIFNWIQVIYNTHGALILPGIFTAFGIFLLRQFYATHSRGLSEAAKIEGAKSSPDLAPNYYRRSRSPRLVSLIILSFTGNWNEFVNPLVFLAI